MNKNFLKTTLLSMTLLSLSLSASNCSGGVCMIDLSSLSSKKIENLAKKQTKEDTPSMIEDESFEYELSQLAQSVEDIIIDSSLPNSEYYCEDNLKVVILEESEHLYTCA